MTRYSQKPQDISQVLHHSPLAKQQQQVYLAQKLNAALAEFLQLEQPSFCQVATIKAGRAVILCQSAAWATRLKMQRAAILDNFRQKILPDLAGIDIDVSPHVQQSRLPGLAPKKNAHVLSAQAAATLRQLATGSHGALQQALLKLADNAPAETVNSINTTPPNTEK